MPATDYDNLTDEELAAQLGKLSQPVTGDRDTDLQRLRVAQGEIPWDDDQYAKGEKEKVWTEEHPGAVKAQEDTAYVDPRTDPNSEQYDPNYDPNA